MSGRAAKRMRRMAEEEMKNDPGVALKHTVYDHTGKAVHHPNSITAMYRAIKKVSKRMKGK